MDRLRARVIFNDSRFMLIAVESLAVLHSKTSIGCYLSGNIEPIAVIVCAPGEMYALDMDAKQTIIDPLRQEIPELEAMIASFYKA